MPIKVQSELPAIEILNQENIFIMDERRAMTQDIRPLRIVILNLMPKKIETETQLLRMLGNTPLQIEVELLQTATYTPKNISRDHLLKFYKTFDDIKDKRFDGMVITGAPVEQMDFEEVVYWRELCEIMEWAKTNVFSTFHICWGAQAGLNYHYGIKKYTLDNKVFGVFEHDTLEPAHALLHGFDETFLAPHSRHTEIRADEISANPHLKVLSTSPKAGVYIVADDANNIYVTGHSEYDRETLAGEYFRDVEKGLLIDIPENYFPDNNPANKPLIRWRSHGNILYSNWLNYFVYQETPYDYVD